MKDIAVIILNYNSSDFTLQCVDSILEHTAQGLDYTIIVVDNHSKETEREKLAPLKDRSRIKILYQKENLGYASGNMKGYEAVNAAYYYFLNNDTVLLNDVLSILFSFMETHLEAGVCSGQMYHEDGSLGVNFNYFPNLRLKLLGSGLLRWLDPAAFPRKKKNYRAPLKVPLLNGSSLFVRGSSFRKIGGFDTSFFLYCEEEDLALRLQQLDQSCYLVPEARYIHYQGKSSHRDQGINLVMLKEFFISQHYLYLKHYGKAAALTWRITQCLRSARKFYKHRDYVRLAGFILAGPDKRQSLRYAGAPDGPVQKERRSP